MHNSKYFSGGNIPWTPVSVEGRGRKSLFLCSENLLKIPYAAMQNSHIFLEVHNTPEPLF